MVQKLFGTNNTNISFIIFLKSGNFRNSKIYSKDFPKQFQLETIINKNRYLLNKKTERVSCANTTKGGSMLKNS